MTTFEALLNVTNNGRVPIRARAFLKRDMGNDMIPTTLLSSARMQFL